MAKFVATDVKETIKATKEFTDREEPRKVFWNKYEMLKKNIQDNYPIQVISYYGFGGIGKSSLLHKLKEELHEKEPNAKMEFLDFEKLVELHNNLIDILKSIRQDLKDRYQFTFPIFDLVTYVYETKLGKTATKPELNSIFDENKELNFLKDVITEIPLIGTISKVISYADRGRNLLKERLQNNLLKERLEELENSSVEEIKENLAYYFSLDFAENIKNETVPFVFFIDTYEKLVNELTQVGDVLKNDLWLRGDDGLILRIPNVIWVIAGREKLKWEEMDSSWEGTLEQHLLGNLSFQDTSHFLKTAGIEREELIHELYDLTHGTPMYLDMCVDTFIKLKQKNIEPKIEDFGTDTTKLIKRFLMYMNDTERDFSTMLAFIPSWTDDTIEDISRKMIGSFSYSLYEKVKNFSFVVNENGVYKMHETIKDIIIANTNEVIRERYMKLFQEETNQEVEEIKKEKEEKNVALSDDGLSHVKVNIDVYESKNKYLQLIIRLIKELTHVSDRNEFQKKGAFLIQKIEDYEDTFNYFITDDTLKNFIEVQKQFEDTEEYIKLKVLYENNTLNRKYCRTSDSYSLFEAYEKLKKIYGENDERAFMPFIDCLKKAYPMDFLLESPLKEDKVVTISKMYSILEHHLKPKSYEHFKLLIYYNSPLFLEEFQDYIPLKIDKHYVELLASFLYYTLKKYNNYEEEDKKKLIYQKVEHFVDVLKSDPKLVNYVVLSYITNIIGTNKLDYDTGIDIIFHYLVSIKDVILESTDEVLLKNYYDILLNYNGGRYNSQYGVVTGEIRDELLTLMEEVYHRYGEIYGKEHNKTVDVLAYIMKIKITMPQYVKSAFSEIDEFVKKFGYGDAKTISLIKQVGKALQNIMEVDSLKKVYQPEEKLVYFQKFIRYVNETLDEYEIKKENYSKVSFEEGSKYEFQEKDDYLDTLDEFLLYIGKPYSGILDILNKEKILTSEISQVLLRIDKLQYHNEYVQCELLYHFYDFVDSNLSRYFNDMWDPKEKYVLENVEYLAHKLFEQGYNRYNMTALHQGKFILDYLQLQICKLKEKVMNKYSFVDKEKELEEEISKAFYNSHSYIFDWIVKGNQSRLKKGESNISESLYEHEYYECKYCLKVYSKQEMLVNMFMNHYGKNDSRTLYEELILTLLLVLMCEEGAVERIDSIYKKANTFFGKDKELIGDIEYSKRIVDFVEQHREKEIGNGYKKIPDVSKIQFEIDNYE